MAATQAAQKRAQRLMQNATKGHGVFMAKVGQVWAFPSLLAFSIGAFITLGGEGLLPGGVATAARIGATIVLLISGVLALEIALFSIGDAITRKRLTARMVWDILLVLVVGPLETWTLYLLITGQPANGPTDLMRAAEAVMATAYLGTLVLRPPTDRDFVRIIGSRAAERAMEKLEMIPLDAVGMGRLYRIQAVGNDDTLSWSQRAEKLVAVMEELAPGEQERLYQQRIAALEATLETAQAQARTDAARHIETAQRQVEAANSAATQRTLDAILSLVATGTLPDWLTEQRPDLAGFSLAQLAGGNGGGHGGRKSGAGGIAALPAREPASQAERVRRWLLGQGIEPCKAPEGKRGVWLRVADVDVLTDGHASASETHQALVKRLGNGAVVGRALVAPYEPVMRELYERHLLTDTARQWWASQQSMQSHSGDDAADDSQRDNRSNVVAMRA